jgi:Mg2+ and Co2+ transporter CorA
VAVLLTTVLTMWQRMWAELMLGQVQRIWSTTETQKGLRRGKAVSDRLVRLRELRNQHAVLIASGTFGPVFDSGSQAEFWTDVQAAFAIDKRREELDKALDALAAAAEVEASVNLERLLGFFTLVVGVPSLVFAVLGVNINKVTSRADGIPFLLIVGLFVACLILGAAAFFLAMGFSAPGARRARRFTDPT